MTQYQKYLKSWTSERGITSYLGSDKPAFQKDWKEEKSAPSRFGEEMGREVSGMGGEDINRAGEPFKKPESMGGEDINRAGEPFKKPKLSAVKAKASKIKADFPTSMSAYARWFQERPKEVREALYQHKRLFNYGDKDSIKGAIKWLRAMASGRTNEELDALILEQYKDMNWRSNSTLARAMRGQDFSDEWVKSNAEADRLEKIKKDKEEEERQERWNQMIAEQIAKWKGRAKYVPSDSTYGLGRFQFLKPDKFGAFWCFTPKSDYFFGVVKPDLNGGEPLLFKFGEEEMLDKTAEKFYFNLRESSVGVRNRPDDAKEIFWKMLSNK